MSRVNSDGSFAYNIFFGDGFSLGRYYDGKRFRKLKKLNRRMIISPVAREDGTVLFSGLDIGFFSHILLQKGRNTRKLDLPKGRFYRNADRNFGYVPLSAADDGLAVVKSFGMGKVRYFYYENNQPKKLKKPKGEKWRNLSFVDMTACGDIMFINNESGDLYIYQRSTCSDN